MSRDITGCAWRDSNPRPSAPKARSVRASSRAYGRTRSSVGASSDREWPRCTDPCRPYWHADGTSGRPGCKLAAGVAGARQSGDHGEVADARTVRAGVAAMRRRCVPRSAGLPALPGRGRWGRGPAARRPEGRRRRISAPSAATGLVSKAPKGAAAALPQPRRRRPRRRARRLVRG
jgi:hypothetical protein